MADGWFCRTAHRKLGLWLLFRDGTNMCSRCGRNWRQSNA